MQSEKQKSASVVPHCIAGSARFALIKPIFKKRALPSWRFRGLDTIARREKEMHTLRAARWLFVNTFIWLRTPAAAAVNILPKKAIKEQFGNIMLLFIMAARITYHPGPRQFAYNIHKQRKYFGVCCVCGFSERRNCRWQQPLRRQLLLGKVCALATLSTHENITLWARP
jgi:hypothetical protein